MNTYWQYVTLSFVNSNIDGQCHRRCFKVAQLVLIVELMYSFILHVINLPFFDGHTSEKCLSYLSLIVHHPQNGLIDEDKQAAHDTRDAQSSANDKR